VVNPRSRAALCDEIERLKRSNVALTEKVRELKHFIDTMPPDLHTFGLEHRERVALARVNEEYAHRIVDLETRCAKCGLRVLAEKVEQEAEDHPLPFGKMRK
jgi:predicted RNase H-like nuclease (RuvC/YqgF family)